MIKSWSFVLSYILLGVLIFICSLGCRNTVNGESAQADRSYDLADKKVVRVVLGEVKAGTFEREIIGNGKVKALEMADVRFPVEGKIAEIYVTNGSVVARGALLARLDDEQLKLKVARSQEALSKSLIDLDDRLIDYGFRLKDSAKVPADIMRIARVKSGYVNSLYECNDAMQNLEAARILAPFGGKVADMDARVFNHTGLYKKLCSIIDDSRMQVEFDLLETEFRSAGVNAKLEIIGYDGEKPMRGVVSSINPEVDDNGLVRIKGIVANPEGHLINGMSVRVVLKVAMHDQLYVPREAVLSRQNKEVVFTYEGGRARWHYVETGPENRHFISIRSGLAPNTKVIIGNNINLADDALVVPEKITREDHE